MSPKSDCFKLILQNAEVGTKDDLVAHLTEDLQKTMGMKALAEERLKKDVEDARRKLKRERTLKLDAFQEVNRLLGEMQVGFTLDLDFTFSKHIQNKL